MAEFTASASSGYMTDVRFTVVGDMRCMLAHYSSPNATSNYIDTGFNAVYFVNVQDADPVYYTLTANSVGGLRVHFTGLVVGSTGYIFVLGS